MKEFDSDLFKIYESIDELNKVLEKRLEELQNLTNIVKRIDTKYSHLRKVFVNTHISLNKNTKD